jgi:hypothetical protein
VRAKNWTGSASAPRWYAAAVGLFLGIRAVTTLAAGASFAVPGDGWRSVFQLAAVAVLAAGIASPRAARAAVAAVTVTYLLATAWEVSGGATLLGAIPVDMRDRLVHPLIAVLGVAALLIGRRRAAASRRGAVAAPPA